jgi:integrase
VYALKEPERLPAYLTIPEQERLLAHLAQSGSLAGRRDYALVATALFCGLRCEERECEVIPRFRGGGS